MATKPTGANWIVVLLLGLIWGAAFLFTELALIDFGPKFVAATRLVIAALFLLFATYLAGDRLPNFSGAENRRVWAYMIGVGVVSNALPFNLISWGQQYVTSAFAGASMTIVPLLLLPLAHIFLEDERMTPRKTLGFSIGFLGTLLLFSPEDILSSTGFEYEIWGRFACLLAACAYAIGALITRLAPRTSMLAFSAGGILVAAVVSVPVALLFEGWPMGSSWISWGGAIYLAVFATALATVLLVWTIKTAGASFMSLVNYQVPLWALVFGTLILAEPLPTGFILALCLILLGLFVSRFDET